jgi:DNA-binding MarR family transcriptional regulator
MVWTTPIATRGDQDVGQPRSPQQRKSINFHVHALASSLFKGAAQYYGAHFGVGLPEMRVLSNLGREGPLAAHQIVTLTAMDKGLVSRVLTTLSRRRFVTSSTPKTDPRRRTWQLSRAGQDLVDRLRPEWHRREAIIQAGLSAAEQTVLSDLLQRMFVASEKLRADETVELQALSKPGIRKRARARPVNGRAVHPTASASLSRVR